VEESHYRSLVTTNAMTPNGEKSPNDDVTFTGKVKRQQTDMSLGDERTLGDGLSGQETIIDDIEVVDLEARYRIDGTLGQGGMGAVLLATDTRLRRKVAIKRILGEAAGNRMAVQRFLTEATSIAALNHPNIVQIYDYGRAKDGPFLSMEYVDGGSLLDRCSKSGLPLEEVIDLACQLCDGLARAHDLGIIHRDIKPSNILLTSDGIPKLADFGLAKASHGDRQMTVTGKPMGTPDFMPPEQQRDAGEVDARSDLWSLAATVYQMATGRSPKIIRFDLLPAELTKVLGKALEDAKEDRYQAARELRDALKASLRAATPHSPVIPEGQCPSCGVQNDSSRRFCRGCGGSLEAPCLSCDKAMPMWEEICGSCGAKQKPLVETRRAELTVLQAKAEGLLGEFEFDKSANLAMAVRGEPHPRLAFVETWAVAFLAEVEATRERQQQKAVKSLAEAIAHEESHDYLSAVYALEVVPAAFRGTTAPGTPETVEAVLDRVKRKQAECRRLDSLIRERLARHDYRTLEPEVNKLLVLEPFREDLLKVRQQLVDRRNELREENVARIAVARACLGRKDYMALITAIDGIDETLIDDEARQLRQSARQALDRISVITSRLWGSDDGPEHQSKIFAMRSGRQVESDVAVRQALLTELLQLRPDDSRAHTELAEYAARQRAEEIAIVREQVATRFEQLFSQHLYKKAADSLACLEPDVMTAALTSLLEKARNTCAEVERLRLEIQSAGAAEDDQRAASVLDNYLQLVPHDDKAGRLKQRLCVRLEYRNQIRFMVDHHDWRRAFVLIENEPEGGLPWSIPERESLHDTASRARADERIAVQLRLHQLDEKRQQRISAVGWAAAFGSLWCVICGLAVKLIGDVGVVAAFLSMLSFALAWVACCDCSTPTWYWLVLSWLRGLIRVLVVWTWLPLIFLCSSRSFGSGHFVAVVLGAAPTIAIALWRMPTLLYWTFVNMHERRSQLLQELQRLDLHAASHPARAMEANALNKPQPAL